MARVRHTQPLNLHMVLFLIYAAGGSLIGGMAFAAFVPTALTPTETWLTASGVLAAGAIAGWFWFRLRRARRAHKNTI